MTPVNAQAIIDQLTENSMAYTTLLRTAVKLQLQIKSTNRNIRRWHEEEEAELIRIMTGITFHLKDAIKVILKPKKYYEKIITDLSKQLPVWPWAEKIRGVGPLGLGLMIGEIGNPSDYANPAKVWKRMGVAVMEDGRAQRRVKGPAGILQGFSPTRRALMHVVGDALIKQNKMPDGSDGEYRRVYLDRKVVEQQKAPELALIVHHKRAMRYMEKRLLLHLWRAWQASCPMSPTQGLPANSPQVLRDEGEPK